MKSEYISFNNYNIIAGLDEAGRGPIAGPVVASAVILPKENCIKGIADSKKLSAQKREKLCQAIKGSCLDYAIEVVHPEVIDKLNILQATFLAMKKCLNSLKTKPDFMLVDGPYLPHKYDKSLRLLPAQPVVKGDDKFHCIAAASILAKVCRDELMINYHKKYPEYGFDSHKGYPTKKHLKSIKLHGISPIHRKTFSPVKRVLFENENKLFDS